MGNSEEIRTMTQGIIVLTAGAIMIYMLIRYGGQIIKIISGGLSAI